MSGMIGAGALAVAAFLGLAAAARAQAVTVRGTVRDPVTGRPVPGVRVTFTPSLRAWTDTAGGFVLDAPPLTYTPILECPRSKATNLERTAEPLTVGDAPTPAELQLVGGSSCLAPLTATEFGEFGGIYRGSLDRRLLRLCGDTAYALSITFTPQSWQALNRLAERFRDDPARPELFLVVRGRLRGPGFFGRDGETAYALDAEQVRRVAQVRRGECPI